MKNRVTCELCSSPATTYCESDQASLCWHCDSKVHKANFLVSKHTRSLLCHLCQNSSPWTASGPMLPPSLSLCLSCASNTTAIHADNSSSSSDHHHHDAPLQPHRLDDDDYDSFDDDVDAEDDSSYDGSDEDDDKEDDDEDDEDNQVVPLTSLDSGVCSTEADNDDDDDNDDGRMSPMVTPSLKRKREFHLLS